MENGGVDFKKSLLSQVDELGLLYMNFVAKTLKNVMKISSLCIVWEENGNIMKGNHIWNYLGDDGKLEFDTGSYLHKKGLKVPNYFEYNVFHFITDKKLQILEFQEFIFRHHVFFLQFQIILPKIRVFLF